MRKISSVLLLLGGMGITWAASVAAAQEPALVDMAIGRPDAPVTIIEYASMTCPHCARFHEEMLPKLKAEYIDTGKVRLVYRDFPLDGYALRAAAIARCAGPERYFAFVDVIYRQQKTWARPPDPLKNLEQIARLGGIGPAQFKACLENQQVQNYVVQSRLDGERNYKVSGTPTFVIGEKPYTGVDGFEALKKILDPIVAKAGGS